MSVYDFSVKNVEGGTTSLSDYKGKVLHSLRILRSYIRSTTRMDLR